VVFGASVGGRVLLDRDVEGDDAAGDLVEAGEHRHRVGDLLLRGGRAGGEQQRKRRQEAKDHRPWAPSVRDRCRASSSRRAFG
jgi:hypothetical protein